VYVRFFFFGGWVSADALEYIDSKLLFVCVCVYVCMCVCVCVYVCVCERERVS
jgi:hypothetical protein